MSISSSNQTPMPIIIAGAGGRMGKALIRLCLEKDDFRLVGALERETHAPPPDAPPVPISHDAQALLASLARLPEKAALIDFTMEGSATTLAAAAADKAAAYIVGTTGLTPQDEAAIEAAARKIPVVRSGNMSLGVALLAELIRQAAAALPPSWDIEILETHHREKRDAPSGTALMLGDAAAKGRGSDLASLREDRRMGRGKRREKSIGFASLRGGTLAGDHSALLAGEGERLTLHHSAETRDIFAEGALKASLWTRGRAPGLYAMSDVLGFSS